MGEIATRFSRCLGMFMSLWALVLAAPADGAERIAVFVSIVPQKFFVEKIGGERVEVSVMVEPGASPHIYEPRPRQMAALSKTKIYFAIGVGFERVWLAKIAAINRQMHVVHTEAGIERIPLKAHHDHEDRAYYDEQQAARGEEHLPQSSEHQPHPGIKDPHVWLSPPLVMLQARNILVALQTVDPSNRNFYEAHFKRFMEELVQLDTEIMGVFAANGNDVEFMVFHPAWGYFAQAYGLRQVPVEMEGKEPKPSDLRRLIEHAKTRGIKVIFAQPQFSTKSAETIAEAIGGKVAFADPLAADWSTNLRELAMKFKAALR